MNNLMKTAEKKLRSVPLANIEDKENLLTSALNDISNSISQSILPVNDMTRPFVAAVLSQYNDFLCQNMDCRAKIVYHDIKVLISKQGKVIKIVLPRKDDQNERFDDES